MDSFLQDVRYGVRGLIAKPGFTLAAVLTLALGIGANSAIFSVVNGVLLKPLPYDAPDRLVQFWETNPIKGWTQSTVAPANLFDWQEQNTSFEDIAAYIGSDTKAAGLSDLQLTSGSEPERIKGLFVTGNIFSVLGVNAALGRTFYEAETWGKTRRAVISFRLWKRRFNSDPDIIGTAIPLNGVDYEIVGVMPEHFYLPSSDVELWVPMGWDRARIAMVRRPHFLRAIGRLKPGVTLGQAQEELTGIAGRLEQLYPNTNTQMGVSIGPLREWIVGDVRTALMIFLAAVGSVLLIACANVANLMLVRGSGRSREIAIRAALGASRVRIVRQLVVESLLLAAVGGGIGLLFALWGRDLLLEINPGNIPRLDEVTLDGRVLGFTAATVVLTSVLFGLLPSIQSTRLDLTSSLKTGGEKGAVGPQNRRSRDALVILEVALSFVLVIGAGLMVRSFVRLQRVDPGFRADHLLTFSVSLPGATYPKSEQSVAFFNQLEQSLASVSGVESVGAGSKLPLKGYNWTSDFTIEGRPPEDYGKEVRHKEVTPKYFETLGVPILSGRGFEETDTEKAQQVVIINRTLAMRHFATENPLGKRLKFSKPDVESSWVTIVGVVDDVRQDSLRADPRTEIYQPFRQRPTSDMSVVVRTNANPSAFTAVVRTELRRLDPGLVAYDVQTGDELVYQSLERDRFAMMLLGIFAGLALLLAAVGIYGVISYSVAQRTHEMGVRVALGARSRDVMALIIGGALRVTAAGIGIGVVAAYGLTRLLSSLLYDVSTTDPVTFIVVGFALLVVAIGAGYFPARRSATVDPVIALKYE